MKGSTFLVILAGLSIVCVLALRLVPSAKADTLTPSGMSVSSIARLNGEYVTKVYDYDNNTVCYIFAGYGISCLKN